MSFLINPLKKTQNNVSSTVKYSEWYVNEEKLLADTNAKYNSYKYKDWDYLKIFCVLYLVRVRWFGGKWVRDWWVGGDAVSGLGVGGRWVASNMVRESVVGGRWVGWRPVGGSAAEGRCSVEDLSVGWWPVVDGWWVGGRLSVVVCLSVVGSFVIRRCQ